MIGTYFLDVPVIGDLSNAVNTGVLTVAAFAVFVGVVILARLHVRHIMNRTSGRWYLSIWLLIMMFLVSGVGLIGGTRDPNYLWINDNVRMPIDAAISCLTAFFIASGAYRAFRIRNIESTLLLISGTILMLGAIGIGEVIPGIVDLSVWLVDVPTMAANRGIIIAIGVGGVLMGLRTLVGLEKGALTEE